MNQPEATVILGSFNSELYWKDPAVAGLPAVFNPDGEKVLSAMDELLACLAKKHPGSRLITRYPFHPVLHDYLRSVGFDFSVLPFGLEDERVAYASAADIPTLFTLAAGREGDWLPVDENTAVDVFSVLPGLASFCRRHGLNPHFPPLEAVTKVNSKYFSTLLNRELLHLAHEAVCSTEALKKAGEAFLADGKSFLVKEAFGVSGKGNSLISTVKQLDIICRHVHRQEKAGKGVLFIVEPFYEKEIDFSCQLMLSATGAVDVLSVQEMKNTGFAFSGIRGAAPELTQQLERRGYFEQVVQIAARVHTEGYFGNVCIDSMVLTDGRIIPLVEINARKSMGYLNYEIGRALGGPGGRSEIVTFFLQVPAAVTFEILFDALLRHDLLFTPGRPEGFLPLSANTFAINKHLPHEQYYSGRLYLGLLAEEARKEAYLGTLARLLASLGILIT